MGTECVYVFPRTTVPLETSMKKSLLLSGAVALALAFSAPAKAAAPVYFAAHAASHAWVGYTVMGCAAGIILAAMVKNQTENRPLTATEAWTCGIAAFLARPQPRRR